MNDVPKRNYGEGSVYLRGNVYWITYVNQSGDRKYESSKSKLRSDAELLLSRRLGSIDKTVSVSLDRLNHLEQLEGLLLKYIKSSLDISLKHQSSYFDRIEDKKDE